MVLRWSNIAAKPDAFIRRETSAACSRTSSSIYVVLMRKLFLLHRWEEGTMKDLEIENREGVTGAAHVDDST
jgi:hypothetical protein